MVADAADAAEKVRWSKSKHVGREATSRGVLCHEQPFVQQAEEVPKRRQCRQNW
jgi:hypothetical protein